MEAAERKEVQTVSYMVARMRKMKADNLVGIGSHNQRKTDNHSNKDIDVERSHLNYDLVEGRTENYKTDIQNFIEENKAGKRATRKDAVLVNEWIISSDKMFFDDKDDKDIERFFTEAKEYFADKFGDDNIRYAQVHLDETTPHMHLGVVPFDKDNKLSAKRVFNRATLIEIQDELPALMQERGFDIQRGEKGSERKNMSVPEYKAFKDQKKALEAEINDLKRETEQRKGEIKKLTEAKPKKLNVKALDLKPELEEYQASTGEKNLFGKEKTGTKKRETGNLIISKDKFEKLRETYSEMATAYTKAQKYLESDVVEHAEDLTEAVNYYATLANEEAGKVKALEEENKGLKQQVTSLKNEMKTVYQTVKEHFKRGLKGNLKRVQGVMNTFAQDISKTAPRGEFSRLNEKENKQGKRRNRGMSR